MNTLRMLLSRSLDLIMRRRRDARLADEIALHLDELTREYVARGMAPDDARRAAKQAFGRVERVAEEYRDQRGWPWLDGLLQDVRFALRMMAKERRLTAAIVIALGLGIGVNNAVFTLVNTALIRDLPFPEPERLLRVATLTTDRRQVGVSYADFVDAKRALASVVDLAASTDTGATLSEVSVPAERVRATFISAGGFAVLGEHAALGRTLEPGDEAPGAEAVLVIGHRLWQARYRGDPNVIGRGVRVDGVPSTIVGVMPEGFAFPLIAQVWQPLGAQPDLAASPRDLRPLFVFGRRSPDADVSRVRTALETLARDLAAAHPATNRNVGFDVGELHAGGEAARTVLTALMGMVAAVLLIACANAASLLLARSTVRAREIAIRTALGASRRRIVRQLLIECLMLAVVAAAVGAVLSTQGARLLAIGFSVIEPGVSLDETRPYWVDLTLDRSSYTFIGIAGLLSTLLFGLVPALQTSRSDVNHVLKDGGRAGVSTRARRRWMAGFVVAEIALTVVLLTAAGLVWRTFAIVYRTDTALDPADLIAARLTLSARAYETEASRRLLIGRLDERLTGASPSGVALAATVATDPPFVPVSVRQQLTIAGRPDLETPRPPLVPVIAVGNRYFDTVRLPLVRGRALHADTSTDPESAVVNERFAAVFLPGADPIGHRIRLVSPTTTNASAAWFTIVGIARNVPTPGSSGNADQPVVYVPLARGTATPRTLAVLVRSQDVSTAIRTLRERVHALDPELPLSGIEPVEAARARMRYPQRLVGTWFGILAAVALALVSVALFALTAHAVNARTHEMSVRLALGATMSSVMRLIVRPSAVQLAAGLALGLIGARLLGSYFQMFPIHVPPSDLTTLACVVGLLVAVGTAAAVVPARRVLRADPAATLRHD